MSEATTEHQGLDWIKGIDTRLEVMSPAPLVLSTPVNLLAEDRITDKKYLFVRNIQDLPEAMTMEPLPIEGWEIERATLKGLAHATCGGRSPNDDFMDTLLTLLINAENGPRISDGVEDATVPASRNFPYLAPPNPPQPPANKGATP